MAVFCWLFLGVVDPARELKLAVLLFLVLDFKNPSSIETIEFRGLSKLAMDKLLVLLD